MVVETFRDYNYFKDSPSWAFRQLTNKELEEITKKKTRDKAGDIDESSFILCRSCGNVITSTDNKVERSGKHKHTFTNPKGYVFQIGCFSTARGTTNQGIPTMEYTWFAGFNWCFTLCLRCFVHLGWFYQSGEESFYGLILDNLMESTGKK